MINRFIDGIERSIHFLFEFWKNNPIYFVCSLFYYVISSLMLGGTAESFLIILAVYSVSLIIGFSSLGEKLLRLLNRVRPLETKRETEYLQPLFDEVYAHAKEKYKRLRTIEICIVDNIKPIIYYKHMACCFIVKNVDFTYSIMFLMIFILTFQLK